MKSIERLKKCGMFSHTMDVQNSKYLYIQETSREACECMYTFDYFRMGHVYITGLKSNQTRPVILAEHIDNDGTRHGRSLWNMDRYHSANNPDV